MRFGISTKTEDNDYCKVSSRGAEHRIRFAVTECKDFKLKLDLIVLVGIPDLDPFAFPVSDQVSNYIPWKPVLYSIGRDAFQIPYSHL